MSGAGRLPGNSNYFIGKDPSKWRTGIPTYARVKYEGVYPSVSLVYYGTRGNVEYDFVVAPGADPGRIAMAVDGGLSIDERGDLMVATEVGDVRFQKPLAYQAVGASGRARRWTQNRCLVGTEKFASGLRLAIAPDFWSSTQL